MVDGNGGYHYSHDETATIRLYTSSSQHNNILNARVLLESTSTLQSSTPLFLQQQTNNDTDNSWDIRPGALTNGTPFSNQILELLSHYPLQRLLIRVGDASTSSSGSSSVSFTEELLDEQQLQQEERAKGPSGTSVFATFVSQSSLDNNNNNYSSQEKTKVHYQDEYASLLRYLLDNTLFPPCGAPLDSLRVRKHGHSILVHSPTSNNNNNNDEKIQTVNVESYLAADAATFCNPGITSLLLSKQDGWGMATNNGACHSTSGDTNNWGLFDSLFSSSSEVRGAGSTVLSELLLGSSLDATPWESATGGGSNKRNSVWVDMQVSPSCFVSSSNIDGDDCTVKVTRGTSYRVAMPSQDYHEQQTLNLSLGDILIGRQTQEQSSSTKKEGWTTTWHPCPLSDSSRILMDLPKGYDAKFMNDVKSISDGSLNNDTTNHGGRIEFNILASKDGYIDLKAPWTQLYHSNNDGKYLAQQSSPSLYGISRTVQRPLGISSSGTLIFVLRHGKTIFDTTTSSEEDQSNNNDVVKVQSLDVLPGTLLKPRMHTLRMTLYQGGGAGGDRFVPPIHSDVCECSESDSSSNQLTTSDQCGVICRKDINLSSLQDHRLTLHPDGSILLERTVLLQPDSSLWMMVDFDEAYLPFQKFPADANRGVDIFPSRATFTPTVSAESNSSSPSITLYSPSLLILPPVPDMSMPFNVISLSCTLWAFVLGSLLNILVRRGTESVKRELTGEKEKRPIDKIKERVKDKVGRLKEKLKKIKGNLGGNAQAEDAVEKINKENNQEG